MRGLAIMSVAALATAAFLVPAKAEILAMMNYESKTADSLKSLKLSGPQERQEGIAVMDVDPQSANFGRILMQIPLPPDLVAHHIFYDRSMTKAYLTALGKSELHVIDMKRFPYRLDKIDVAACKIGEDVIFSDDNNRWYLTCMGSQNVIVGDVNTDEIVAVIDLPKPYPHGFAINNAIDRALVTSTVRASDLGDAGETITVIEPSTNKTLESYKVSNKPSPSGEAPVEILFVPGAEPPVAYVTNMYGGTLWTASWNPSDKKFEVAEVFDFATLGAGVPLEIYFNNAVNHMYISTAKPGQIHIFDVGMDPAKPKLIKSLPAGEGAHHIAITADEKYAFVQNALLNLPGMSEGTITVVDLQKGEVVATIDTLKNMGLNPNSIVLLPDWNNLAGH